MMRDVHVRSFSLNLTAFVAQTFRGDSYSQSSSDIRDSCHVFDSLVPTEYLVHLFDAAAFCFWNTEVYPDTKDDTEDYCLVSQ